MCAKVHVQDKRSCFASGLLRHHCFLSGRPLHLHSAPLGHLLEEQKCGRGLEEDAEEAFDVHVGVLRQFVAVQLGTCAGRKPPSQLVFAQPRRTGPRRDCGLRDRDFF